MDITFLGGSSFRLKGKTASLVMDPYEKIGNQKFPKTEADIVTVSHSHASHSATDQVTGNFFLSSGPGEYEIKGVKIIGVASFHDNKKGAEKGKNTIYNIKIDGINVCHLGDLGQEELSSDQIDSLGNVDILFVPAGEDILEASAAAKVASALEAKVIIPMHFGQNGGAKPEKFLKEMGSEQTETLEKLSVTADKLPEELKIYLLKNKVG